MTVEVKTVRQVKYISPEEIEKYPEFQEMVVSMFRNRVRLDVNVATRGIEYWDMLENMSEFCDTHFTGYWTYQSKAGNSYDYANNKTLDFVTNQVTVFFEHKDDMAVFLKDYAVLAKLGQA